MITLAFAQMMFYLVNSMKAYGGDEGLTLPRRAELGFGLDLGNELVFYYVVLAILLRSALRPAPPDAFALRPRHGRDPRERGARRRRSACRCTATSSSASSSPAPPAASPARCSRATASTSTRTCCTGSQSGTLMIMVILGGVGRLWGGVIGAAVLLGLEHLIADHPHRLAAAAGAELPAARQPRRRHRAARRSCCSLRRASPGCLRAGNTMLRLERRVASASAAWSPPTTSSLEVARGRGARADRPERRRQDHAHRPDLRQPRPRQRARSASSARTSRALRQHQRVARGPRAQLPDHQHLQALQRARQPRARGAGAQRLELLVLAPGGRGNGAVRRGARDRRRRSAWTRRAESIAGNLAHGEQRALEVGLALATRPQARAARRADGRHGAGGVAAHDRAHRAHPRRRSRCCWSSTTWTRCSASPTASRCWSTAA